MVKSSLQKLTPRFSTHQMVLEYAERLYGAAHENGRLVREGRFGLARPLARVRQQVESGWSMAYVRRIEQRAASIEVEAYLGGVSPDAISFCDATGDLLEIERVTETKEGAHCFSIERGPAGQCIRMFPTHPSMVHVQELGESISFEI